MKGNSSFLNTVQTSGVVHWACMLVRQALALVWRPIGERKNLRTVFVLSKQYFIMLYTYLIKIISAIFLWQVT